MSYNLLAQSACRLDWRALREAAIPGLTLVEVFPVPGEQEGDALGIAVPARHATAAAWGELEGLFDRLRPFALTMIDLYSGQELSPETLPDIRARFLGSDS